MQSYGIMKNNPTTFHIFLINKRFFIHIRKKKANFATSNEEVINNLSDRNHLKE